VYQRQRSAARIWYSWRPAPSWLTDAGVVGSVEWIARCARGVTFAGASWRAARRAKRITFYNTTATSSSSFVTMTTKANTNTTRNILNYSPNEWRSHRLSALSTRAPCAVERGALSGWGSNLSPGASLYHRIISNNSYTHDKQGDNPGQEEEGSTVSSINSDRCRHLDLAASRLSAAPAWAEVNRLGWRNTAPVRAKPDSRPRLEGARYRKTRQAARMSHTYIVHLPIPLLPG